MVASTPPFVRPERLGKYRVVEEVGQGGMAFVYRGVDDVLGKTVAVKVLRPELMQGEQYLERFKREARIAASLEHPNVINVFDWGVEGGLYYFVMNYIEGVSVYALLAAHGRLPLGDALRVTLDLLSALEYAHGRDVIHRDLKPENLMVSLQGVTVLTDFGVARPVAGSNLTRLSQRIGTPIYMSPEQVKGEALDCRSDLYAAGVALFELSTGRLPFEGKDDIETGHLHVVAPPPRPSGLNPRIPGAVEAAMLRALAKSRAERFQTAGELRQALVDAAAQSGLAVPDRLDVPTMAARLRAEGAAPPAATPLPPGARSVDEFLGDMQRGQRSRGGVARYGVGLLLAAAVACFFAYTRSVSLVTLCTVPPGAEVEEGKRVWPGRTPFVMERAWVGSRRVRVVKPGYQPREVELAVEPGRLLSLTVTLTPAP